MTRQSRDGEDFVNFPGLLRNHERLAGPEFCRRDHSSGISVTPVHIGAFCQFSFRWIYYIGSKESTRKEAGKTHLCAVMWLPLWQSCLPKIYRGGSVLYSLYHNPPSSSQTAKRNLMKLTAWLCSSLVNLTH